MTGREWKPGDVGIAKFGGAELRVLRLSWGWADEDGDTYTSSLDAKNVRPLVVIDPEDREQVQRLYGAIFVAFDNTDDATMSEADFRDMQAALREFADPKPPKPDEPTGLGAVIEDAGGNLWVRRGVHFVACDDHCNTGPLTYGEIDVARVLSEGWSE